MSRATAARRASLLTCGSGGRQASSSFGTNVCGWSRGLRLLHGSDTTGRRSGSARPTPRPQARCSQQPAASCVTHTLSYRFEVPPKGWQGWHFVRCSCRRLQQGITALGGKGGTSSAVRVASYGWQGWHLVRLNPMGARARAYTRAPDRRYGTSASPATQVPPRSILGGAQ